jgi:glycerate-2-kinase
MSLRDDALSIWQAGVDAVRAEPLVKRVVRIEGDSLVIGDHRWTRDQFDRLVVVGAGKAATAMAAGLTTAVGDWLPVSGWINVPTGTVPPGESIGHIHVHAARPAGVNEPTAAGVEGTRQILKIAGNCGPRDLCIALISGGGSALLPAPIDGITLADKLAVTRLLSGAGADITELNTVRKHLSEVKGGGLLQACTAGQLLTLVLSDVLGDPLDLIASGPTVPDPSTPSDALQLLNRYDPERSLPDRVYEVLQRERKPQQIDAAASTVLVIGNNAVAVDQAAGRAADLGYTCHSESATACEGAAEQIGRQLAEQTLTACRSESTAPACWISGGEPTVELAPAARRGQGGRNQQLILAAYQQLLDANLSDQQWQRIVMLSGGTDGEDGPTDAAGAVLDATVHQRASEQQLEPQRYLDANDAYTFFSQCDGLIKTGPTGTNVCDVRVVIVRG